MILHVFAARAPAWCRLWNKLGAAVSITESINYETPPIYWERDMAAAGEGATTPIESGTQEVSVVVQVTFAIGS